MHDTEKFVLDICCEASLQSCFKAKFYVFDLSTFDSLISVFPAYFFFKKSLSHRALIRIPPPLLSFLLYESNTLAIYRKKYLLSKNVISKASLKI